MIEGRDFDGGKLPFDPSKDKGLVIAAPVSWTDDPYPGSTKRPCDRCKQPLWIAPAVKEVADREELPVMDPECGTKYLEEE